MKKRRLSTIFFLVVSMVMTLSIVSFASVSKTVSGRTSGGTNTSGVGVSGVINVDIPNGGQANTQAYANATVSKISAALYDQYQCVAYDYNTNADRSPYISTSHLASYVEGEWAVSDSYWGNWYGNIHYTYNKGFF